MVDDRVPSSELNSAFDQSRDQTAHDEEHEKAIQDEFDLRQTEIKIGDNKLAPENTAKFINQTRTGKYADTEQKRNERRAHEHHMLMHTLEQLREQLDVLEAELIGKYGEDFAENLAAELLDDKTYAKIMMISDQEERRHQIAVVINLRIQNGSIDLKQIDVNTDLMEWLNLSDNIRQQRSLTANQISEAESLRSNIDANLLSGEQTTDRENQEPAVVLANGSNETATFDQLLPK